MAAWPPAFAKRGELSFQTENRPFVESQNEDEEDDDQTRNCCGEEDEEEDHDEDENEVETFMKGGHESDVCRPQVDKVVGFCRGSPDASLISLRSELGKETLPTVAWLDERSCEGARSNTGPLTALTLYQRLKKPRFRESSEDPTSIKPSEAPPEDPEAERQLIFVTGLDAWTIHALTGTASKNQVPHLQAALYRHLVFEPFFGLDITPDGLHMFRLEFHIPYHALRTSKSARKDSRKYANEDPLRHDYDISFLGRTNSETTAFLYEAQISCVVAGPDEWRWTAWCFVDTYFELEKKREAVSKYYKHEVRQDPFTRGETMADGKFQNPREYFLTVLRYRMEQVKNEWVQVVEKLKETKWEYEQKFLSHSRRQSRSKCRNFVTKVRWLTKKLSLDLGKTIDSCDEFCCQPAVDFQSTSALTDPRPLLNPIRTILQELKSQKATLETMADNWDDFTRDLEVHLNYETIRVAQLSVKIMLSISSIALPAALFSMDLGVIPFIPPNFRSFLCLIVLFGAVAAIIQLIQLDCFLAVAMSAVQRVWAYMFASPSPWIEWLCRRLAIRKSTGRLFKDEEDAQTD